MSTLRSSGEPGRPVTCGPHSDKQWDGPTVTIPARSPESATVATWLWQNWSRPLSVTPPKGHTGSYVRAGTAGLRELPRRPVWAFSGVRVKQMPLPCPDGEIMEQVA